MNATGRTGLPWNPTCLLVWRRLVCLPASSSLAETALAITGEDAEEEADNEADISRSDNETREPRARERRGKGEKAAAADPPSALDAYAPMGRRGEKQLSRGREVKALRGEEYLRDLEKRITAALENRLTAREERRRGGDSHAQGGGVSGGFRATQLPVTSRQEEDDAAALLKDAPPVVVPANNPPRRDHDSGHANNNEEELVVGGELPRVARASAGDEHTEGAATSPMLQEVEEAGDEYDESFEIEEALEVEDSGGGGDYNYGNDFAEEYYNDDYNQQIEFGGNGAKNEV